MNLVPTSWIAGAELLAVLALMAGSGAAGFKACDLLRQRDAAVASADKASTTAMGALDLAAARGDALAAVQRYNEAQARLRPQYQVIHDKAAPILVTLANCPLPGDAAGVLAAAADLADSNASAGAASGSGSVPDGTGAAPAQPGANGGRPVPARP